MSWVSDDMNRQQTITHEKHHCMQSHNSTAVTYLIATPIRRHPALTAGTYNTYNQDMKLSDNVCHEMHTVR
jgi:hypothetical protein